MMNPNLISMFQTKYEMFNELSTFFPAKFLFILFRTIIRKIKWIYFVVGQSYHSRNRT